MTLDEFRLSACKTEPRTYRDVAERLRSPGQLRLLHAALGLSTESAEFLDALKKHLYYGKVLDETNLLEEVGDLLWYLAIAVDELGFSFAHAMAANERKLKARYKNGFTKHEAVCRDLKEERRLIAAKPRKR